MSPPIFSGPASAGGQILLQATGESRERFFEWQSMPAAWVVFLVVVPLVVIYVTVLYRKEKPVGSRRARWALGALRTAIILAVLGMLARPQIREIVYRTPDPELVMMADDSLSMKVADKYGDRDVPRRLGKLLRVSPEAVEGLSRYDLVHRVLRDGELKLLERLQERARVGLWAFSGGLKKLRDLARKGGAPGQALAEGEGDGGELLPPLEKIQGEERVKQTRLGDSLSEAAAGARGGGGVKGQEEVACIILFSDGQHNSGALQPEDVARKLGQRGIPIYTVGVGNPEPPKDVRVVSLDANDVVLVDEQVPFDAVIASEGFEGERVRVDLLFDSEVVDTEYLTLARGGERQAVRLEHVPRTPGDFVAAVRVELSPGELLEENNQYQKNIKVFDQKIKVLYLEGRPRWEYRFLKNALIRDPTMEAQVILYSADEDFIQESTSGVTPLTSFPGRREELFQYHVVIVGDLESDSLRPEQMELLKDFVSEAGGGVIFIAGWNANPSAYLHTPLNALLPVEVPEGARGLVEGRPSRENFNVELTGVGREHPLMRLDSDADRNRDLWENKDGIESRHLPSFYWFTEVNREKPGAVKLAVHSNPRREHPIYGPRPIFAFQNFGKGRTFFSAVDETWRWRAGVDNLYFYKFWGQVIRWVASGRLMGKSQRHEILIEKLSYTIGDKVVIEARVYDVNMQPSVEESLTLYHQVESGRGAPRPPEALTLSLSKVKGPGSYEGSLVAEELGRHDVWIGTETERLRVKSFMVEVPDLEFRDTRMDRERLKNIARLSGGEYYELDAVASLVKKLEGITKPRQTPIDDRQDDLWDNFWVLLGLTGLLAAEWVYRKMVKLL